MRSLLVTSSFLLAIHPTSAELEGQLRGSTGRELAAIPCARNPDCTVNAWCNDVSYDTWCPNNGAAGNCPSPMCIQTAVTTALLSTTKAPSSTAAVTTKAASTSTASTATTKVTTVSTLSSTTAKVTTTTTVSKAATTTVKTTAAAITTVTTTTHTTKSTAAPPTTSTSQASATLPPSGNAIIDDAVAKLKASNSAAVLQYNTGTTWVDSTLYTWPDMIKAVYLMATTGVGKYKFWLGDTSSVYGLVNVAAFLAQSMKETIQYNACDENNWSDNNVVAQNGGSTYSATSACGQLGQSYQDYTCSAEEDQLAGGKMACDVDPNMQVRASTHASWYGAPAALFCAPRSQVPNAPRWDYTSPWCAQAGGYGYVEPFPENVSLPTYFEYVKSGGGCKDYAGIKTGGWSYTGSGCAGGSCPGSPAPLFGKPAGRSDVEGCCWWGRGVIQTTGVCNFGKLNYYLGARAAKEGRGALYPAIDFCKNPGAVCDSNSPPELKWIAGLFYWVNAVQTYSTSQWAYTAKLKSWVDAGMVLSDTSFIDGASGIVNRGCWNPPACGTGALDGGADRAANFAKVLKAMGLGQR